MHITAGPWPRFSIATLVIGLWMLWRRKQNYFPPAMVLRAILIWSPSGPIRRNKTSPPRVNSVWRFSLRAPMPYDREAIGRIMMDDLARRYRFIEDAEFKAAILEVLIGLRSSIGQAWDIQLSLTVVSAPAQTKFERKGKTMKVEKDDGYKCPRCDGHIPEQFYCRDCGYVPDWRQIETYKTRREAT